MNEEIEEIEVKSAEVVDKIESIPSEEMEQLKDIKNKSVLLSLQVEKFQALLESSEISFENAILKLYNKYNLKLGEDQILESGKINYKE
jgi:hypothetical protein